jgi:tight adherence protein C
MGGFISVKTLAFLTGLLFFWIAYVVTQLIFKPKKISLEGRLPNAKDQEMNDILHDDYISHSAYGKFHKAYVRPYINSHPNLLQQVSRALGINMEKLDQKIKEAKMEKEITVEEIISMKLLGLAGAVLFMGLGVSFGVNTILILFGLIFYLFGTIVPQRMIEQKIKARRENIERNLPEFLDLVKSVTEAGLVVQEAINKVTARLKGPLADEFKRVMAETKSNGGQWRIAMENMAFRNDIDTLSDVVSDILIAYEKGTSITDTLNKEAILMRELRNTKLQEKAKSMSVKLIIPMAIFSFLPLLVLLVAPMVMQMTQQMQ